MRQNKIKHCGNITAYYIIYTMQWTSGYYGAIRCLSCDMYDKRREGNVTMVGWNRNGIK